MRSIIITILHTLTRLVIKKYHPKIIGITGSVGKTATKEAVFSVLSRKFRVRKNESNFNTEVGLPLTVLGAKDQPGRSPFKWFSVVFGGIGLLLWKHDYPEMLVLEMGADKPGDIAQLLSVVQPDVGVITAITPVHTEQFNGLEGVAREKGKLFRAIARVGWVVVNGDDEFVEKIASTCKAQKINYAINKVETATVKASEISVSRSNKVATGIAGVSFKLMTNGTVTPVLLKGVLGEHQVYSALVAASVAQIFEVNMDDIAEGLRKAHKQPGRMRIIEGIKHTTIIDDTYNASPKPMECAIKTASELETDGKTFAVLGDMLELGSISEDEHSKIGNLVAKSGIDVLICVGERARDIARGAESAGMSEDKVFRFSVPEDAGLFVQRRIEQGDLILVKGSRGIGMEKVVKEIMAHPENAGELLVY
jgi:UDP-N-acetylmuramoyl-tripeptide--D-alanyl-D-alanine ligase